MPKIPTEQDEPAAGSAASIKGHWNSNFVADLPPTLVSNVTFQRKSANDERDQLMEALAATKWNKSRPPDA